MERTCIKCGEVLPNERIKFCPKCGTKQTEVKKANQDPYLPPNSVVAPNSHTETNPIQIAAPMQVGKAISVNEQARNYIEKIENIQLKEALYSLSSPLTYGFKGFFIGNSGSKKDKAYDQLFNTLKLSNKVSGEAAEILPFNKMPDEFKTDKLYIITDLQTAVNNLFNLDDFSNESAGNQRKYQGYLEKLIHAPNSSYIVLDGSNVEYKGFVTLDPKIPFIFKKAIRFEDLSNQEIFELFCKELSSEYRNILTPEYEEEFIMYLDRNKRFYPFNNTELAHYMAGECAKNGELTLPEERHQTKSLEDLFSNIIGMNNVKKKLTELNNYLSARSFMEAHGAVLPPFSLNMMFLGNPGVGKTSIARIVAKILFDLGYIREEKLVECTSKDLVSAYSGLTGVKTNRVISRAMGGVLFIDEAYALSNSCGQAGAEAIAILIKAMEDFRGELVVMFAGYTAEMDDFVKSNSGIESRISYNFYFPDYSVDELLEIFMLKLGKTHMTITEEGKQAVRDILKLIAGRRNFGNGRFVDKMLQAVLTKHASLNLRDDEIMTLKKESIPQIDEIMQSIK